MALLEPARDDLFLEVGAGRGALSAPLAARAGRLLAVELDPDCLPDLEARLAPHPAAAVVLGNVLTLDVAGLLAPHRPDARRVRAAGNLPYNIATAIIERLLDPALVLHDLTFLVQLEMAERITAHPRSGQYGYFSVFCQHRAAVRMGFRVPPGAFQPPPKVTSAVVSLRPHSADRLPPVERRALDGITRAAFSHRRKTIANSLRYAGVVAGAPEPLLEAAGIAPSRRAEEVSLEEFERLARVYASSLTQS